MAKTIKVKFGIYVSDGGDGSYSPHLVLNAEVAQRCVDREMEEYGQAVTDGGASEVELEVDIDTGKIISGFESMSDLWGDEEEEASG